MEIERKFLIHSFPEFPVVEENLIQQYFLSVDPYVRIRSKVSGERTSYKLCIKGSGSLSREEVEFPIDEDSFRRLTAICGLEPVVKIQKIYDLDGLTLECNLVDAGTDNGFMYAEIEFETDSEAESFVPPPFLSREVTYDESYKMNRYWEKTRLKKS